MVVKSRAAATTGALLGALLLLRAPVTAQEEPFSREGSSGGSQSKLAVWFDAPTQADDELRPKSDYYDRYLLEAEDKYTPSLFSLRKPSWIRNARRIDGLSDDKAYVLLDVPVTVVQQGGTSNDLPPSGKFELQGGGNAEIIAQGNRHEGNLARDRSPILNEGINPISLIVAIPNAYGPQEVGKLRLRIYLREDSIFAKSSDENQGAFKQVPIEPAKSYVIRNWYVADALRMKQWAQDYFRDTTIQTASLLLGNQGRLLKLTVKSGSSAVPLSFHLLEETGHEIMKKGVSASMDRSERITTRDGDPVVPTGGILLRKWQTDIER